MQRNTTADSQNDFRPPPPPFSLVLALGYALWTGSATMLMAALGFWRMHGLLTVGILGMTGLATAATLWQLRPTTLNFWIWLRQHWLWLLPFAVLLLVTAAHASYYPFTGDDTLARYAYTARMLLQRGSLRGFLSRRLSTLAAHVAGDAPPILAYCRMGRQFVNTGGGASIHTGNLWLGQRVVRAAGWLGGSIGLG
jgi:hypothetical protein